MEVFTVLVVCAAIVFVAYRVFSSDDENGGGSGGGGSSDTDVKKK
jgi:hypothetical protein